MFNKRNVFIFITILSIFYPLLLSASDTSKGGKIRLAILPFSSKGGVDNAAIEVMFENFTIAMVGAGVYSIVERGQLDKALSELKFQRGDVFDDSSAAQLGKMAGAQVVILGSVNYALDTYYLSVRGIDVTTGVIVLGKQEQTKNKNELVWIAEKLAKFISFNYDNKPNSSDIKKNFISYEDGNYTRKDLIFIKKCYENKWLISPSDYEANRSKFRIFIGTGIGLSISGGVGLVSGIIMLGTALGLRAGWWIFFYLPMGFVGSLLPLSAIPFYFADRVKSIYRKATGEKLSFWDRTNFDLRIVTTKESLTNEYNRKISFDLSISL